MHSMNLATGRLLRSRGWLFFVRIHEADVNKSDGDKENSGNDECPAPTAAVDEKAGEQCGTSNTEITTNSADRDPFAGVLPTLGNQSHLQLVDNCRHHANGKQAHSDLELAFAQILVRSMLSLRQKNTHIMPSRLHLSAILPAEWQAKAAGLSNASVRIILLTGNSESHRLNRL